MNRTTHSTGRGPQPCGDCPWRRKSAPGWLGSEATPEEWVQRAAAEAYVECHLDASRHCAGIAIFRGNTGKRPRHPQVLRLDPDRETVFASHREFIEHHRSLGIVSSERPNP